MKMKKMTSEMSYHKDWKTQVTLTPNEVKYTDCQVKQNNCYHEMYYLKMNLR